MSMKEAGPSEPDSVQNMDAQEESDEMTANTEKSSGKVEMVVEASPGDAILFDFRVIHRGTANRSNRWRPILYQTCSRSLESVLFFTRWPHCLLSPLRSLANGARCGVARCLGEPS